MGVPYFAMIPNAESKRRPPSGEQHVLTNGDWELTVVEVGGGIRTLRHRGHDIVDGYAADAMCSGGRGQPLIPWPNRVADGRYTFDGRALELALSDRAKGNAIHGLTRWAHWRLDTRSDAHLTLRHDLDPQQGYQIALALAIEYRYAPEGLTVSLTAKNVGATHLPVGAGFHPYFTLGAPTIDGAVLTVPAEAQLELDARGLPTGTRPVAGEFDFRAGRAIGALVLDHAFTALHRDADGRAHITLADGDRKTTVWLDGQMTHVQLFSGDTLAANVRRKGLAIEPMSCAPNAFADGQARILEVGEAWTCRWGVTVSW